MKAAYRWRKLGKVFDPTAAQSGHWIEEFAQAYENPAEVIRYYFSDRNRLAEVEALVVEQNVVDWVLANAKVVDKQLGFDELMGAN